MSHSKQCQLVCLSLRGDGVPSVWLTSFLGSLWRACGEQSTCSADARSLRTSWIRGQCCPTGGAQHRMEVGADSSSSCHLRAQQFFLHSSLGVRSSASHASCSSSHWQCHACIVGHWGGQWHSQDTCAKRRRNLVLVWACHLMPSVTLQQCALRSLFSPDPPSQVCCPTWGQRARASRGPSRRENLERVGNLGSASLGPDHLGVGARRRRSRCFAEWRKMLLSGMN